jgi:glycosyltransferase involved in cell wall biosynthesis
MNKSSFSDSHIMVVSTSEVQQEWGNYPLISVVIATANRKDWVHEAIESALSQTYPNIELIVVDDGSSDGTYESISSTYGSRVKLIKTPGGNAPSAKNRGAKDAKGEFLAFLDDDDSWYPDKLKKQLELMQRHGESVGVAGAGCNYVDSNKRPILQPTIPSTEEVTYEQCCIKVSLPGSGSNNLIRRAVFEKVGRFDTQLTRGQDRDLWIKIARDHRIFLHPDILCTVRIHDTPRRGVNLDVIEHCRKIINNRIPENNIKRLANGWMYYFLFQRAWAQQKRQALWYLLKSFCALPYSRRMPTNRIKGAINHVLDR